MQDHITMPATWPVTCHTDYVGRGSTFVAIRGMSHDGIVYISTAIKNGATTIVLAEGAAVSDEVAQCMRDARVAVHYVPDTRKALVELSAQAAGYPARQLKIIGITGTKGKTTTTFLLAHILQEAGKKVAYISTVHNKIMDIVLPASLTTPQPDYLHQFLRTCVNSGVEYVMMEVAAQALTLHRVHDIMFDGVVFTNFAHEHLEFYATMDDYFDAKCLIFKQIKLHTPVLINADDAACAPLMQHNFLGFGFEQPAEIQGTIMSSTVCTIQVHDNVFTCPLLMGNFNAYNLLAAVGMALQLDIDARVINTALQNFPGVPGRMQQFIVPNGARFIIDYAHNPSSYQAVLSMLRSQTDDLMVIFGAGGKRDKQKRPIMGGIAADLADTIILTSDNPRTEDPYVIMDDIAAGIPIDKKYKVVREVDREKAIKIAYQHSRAGSVVVILGKGTDEYQIIGEIKIPFSEKQIIQAL